MHCCRKRLQILLQSWVLCATTSSPTNPAIGSNKRPRGRRIVSWQQTASSSPSLSPLLSNSAAIKDRRTICLTDEGRARSAATKRPQKPLQLRRGVSKKCCNQKITEPPALLAKKEQKLCNQKDHRTICSINPLFLKA